MNTLRWTLLLSAVLIIGCNMSGCGIFNTEPFVDAKKDAHGNVTLLDTPRMWQRFTALVDMRVASESKDGQPPGMPTWNDHWMDQIETLRSGGQENAAKYINYIVDARRRAGLPELKGYQSRTED